MLAKSVPKRASDIRKEPKAPLCTSSAILKQLHSQFQSDSSPTYDTFVLPFDYIDELQPEPFHRWLRSFWFLEAGAKFCRLCKPVRCCFWKFTGESMGWLRSFRCLRARDRFGPWLAQLSDFGEPDSNFTGFASQVRKDLIWLMR